MSETGIESNAGGSSINNRFFCHSCSNEIDHAINFKCPLCESGFVELLEESEVQPQASQNENPGQNSSQSDSHSHRNVFNRQSFIQHGIPRTRHIIGNFGLINTGTTEATAIMQDVLRISDQLMSPDFMAVGNMGDYALSRNGLDAIVSQLLNQMDSSGPPPLSESLIESLPYVTIAQEHINESSQCSICWESFSINEQVRKLPCSHIYHDDCIKPWLSQRCTCPICRKSVGSSSNNQAIDDNAMDYVDQASSSSSSSASSDSISSSISMSSDSFAILMPTTNSSTSSEMSSISSSTSSESSSASASALDLSSSSSTTSSQSSEATAPVSVSSRVTFTVSSPVSDDLFTTDSSEGDIDYFETEFECSDSNSFSSESD